MELTTSWKREGIKEGRREGRRDLLLMQLIHRFGALSPEEEAQIAEMKEAQLERLGKALLDFKNRQDLTNWLTKSRRLTK